MDLEILDGKRGDNMKQIGRRIYYDKSTGNAIIDTGECRGDVIETTIEQDFQVYVALTERVRDTVGVLQLEYGEYADLFAQYPYHIDPVIKSIVWGETAYGESLDEVKFAKLSQLKIAEAIGLKTFISSALGAPHTYLSDIEDMLLLNGEYTFTKSDDYDGKPIVWYTVEGGNIEHTKAQFVQVYLDGRSNVQTVKYHRATLEAQVNAAIDVDSVKAIVW